MKKIVLILAILIMTSLIGWSVARMWKNQEVPMQPSPAFPIDTPTQTSPEAQIYRNTEYGFEFQYPKGWTFHAGTFYSPSSKLNLVGASPEEDGMPDPINPSLLVNIVTPDFAEKARQSMENLGAIKTDTITAGIQGKKYTYLFRGEVLIDVIVPAGKNVVVILQSRQKYETIFNQLLATFISTE